MDAGTSKPPIKTLPLSRALSLSLYSESAILQLQEAVADEIEDESWNFKTSHQKHCKGFYQNQNYYNFYSNFFVANQKKKKKQINPSLRSSSSKTPAFKPPDLL
jgi:hypothetical protein